jgi:hypothetical protein
MQTTKQYTETTESSYRCSLSSKQHKLYKKLCDDYNNIGMWAIVSFQTYIESKIQTAISKNHKNVSDLIDVANFAQNDF